MKVMESDSAEDILALDKAFHHAYLMSEELALKKLIERAALSSHDRKIIEQNSVDLIDICRRNTDRRELFDAFLQEYGLSTKEGVTLMRLAEALIRTPDDATARALLRDKLSGRNWNSHKGNSASRLVNLSTNGMSLSAKWIEKTGGPSAVNALTKIGDIVLHKAVSAAIGMMSEHFVLGRDIGHALHKSKKYEQEGFTFSYDMLGEAAHTLKDAERYCRRYNKAITEIAKTASKYDSLHHAPAISVKLSALHPRYEYAQRETCVPALLSSVKSMALKAKRANIGLTIDAEEADKLEVSLLIANALIVDDDLAGWDGLTIAVQSYQRRAPLVLETLLKHAKAAGRKIAIRLVKGAYWDMEIKRAQELGLQSYPVFTRRENTDVSYLACARILLDNLDVVYPQFATHNAATAAAIIYMAGNNRAFEFQRLHGMGKDLHQELMQQTGVRSRIYAPVGIYKDLLPYLVRRLLENGANSSFVNQFLDEEVSSTDMASDPIERSILNETASHPFITKPRDIFDGARLSAKGIDTSQVVTERHLSTFCERKAPITAKSIINGKEIGGEHSAIKNPANPNEVVGTVYSLESEAPLKTALACAKKSQWKTRYTPQQRANCLLKAADRLETEMDSLMALCVDEAGKTWNDANDEVREAVDFCRYYALQALRPEFAARVPLGTVACISPWNFPLAIFIGQVSASLSAGNAVICKPAEQTPLIAYYTVKLLHECGVPADALHLTIGSGSIVGAALVASSHVDGICFTGSTATAKRITHTLAQTNRPLIPLIAETGGLNTMIVDSTALLEQAVSDVVASSFQSAGQRCSACRLVCLQEDIADDFIKMLSGAIEVLHVGDPALLKTDIGPVINQDAMETLTNYTNAARERWAVAGELKANNKRGGFFFNPIAFEIPSVDQMSEEKFGPILHIVRYKPDEMDALIMQINALGYGLTMGLHTRIDSRVQRVASLANVGNLYVNRNQIGAVVGVQPFGGEGLSGTGPKAGGPLYMMRLSRGAAGAAKPLEAPLMSSIELPGPTGESNTLSLHPRGVLAIIGTSDTGLLKRQVLKALSAGNSVVIAVINMSEDEKKALLKTIVDAGGGKDRVRFKQVTHASDILQENIQGIIADGAERNDIAKRLCLRSGAILPVLSIHDDLERYVLERTLTIDTTAAGGNASLLAM